MSRFTIWDLLADGRCSQAVLDFLSRKLVPAEEDARSERPQTCDGGAITVSLGFLFCSVFLLSSPS